MSTKLQLRLSADSTTDTESSMLDPTFMTRYQQSRRLQYNGRCGEASSTEFHLVNGKVKQVKNHRVTPLGSDCLPPSPPDLAGT